MLSVPDPHPYDGSAGTVDDVSVPQRFFKFQVDAIATSQLGRWIGSRDRDLDMSLGFGNCRRKRRVTRRDADAQRVRTGIGHSAKYRHRADIRSGLVTAPAEEQDRQTDEILWANTSSPLGRRARGKLGCRCRLIASHLCDLLL